MAFSAETYAILLPKIKSAISGFKHIEIDDENNKIIFTFNDNRVQEMHFEQPKDGATIESVDINETKHLVLTMSDGNVIESDNEIPIAEKTSELINDAEFITNATNNLANYYKKTDTYTKTQVDDLISNLGRLDVKIVDELPTDNISKTTFYLIRIPATNYYTQYMYLEQDGMYDWKVLGSTEIDLSEIEPVLSEDVTLIGTSLGALPEGTVINKDTTLTQFVKMVSTKRIAPTYTQPIVNLSLSPTSVQEINSTIDVVISPSFSAGDSGGLTSYTIYRDGTEIYSGTTISPYTDNVTLDSNKHYTVNCVFSEGSIKDDNIGNPSPENHILAGDITSSVKTITAVYASFFGAVDTLTPTESDIVALTKDLRTAKGKTVDGINLNNQRFCFAYNKAYGTISSIKDANNFEYINSYNRTEMTINGIAYYVYVLKDATTIEGLKQIFA